MTETYDVGYGKPPKSPQWKNGQSGNQKGRPKTRSDLISAAADILSEPVMARTPEGRTVSLDGYEAAYLALRKKGLKGHVPSLIKAIRIMLELQPALDAKSEDALHKRERILGLLEKMGVEVCRQDAERAGANQ